MGTNVSVQTPPAGDSKYGEMVGDVRVARRMWATLTQLGLVEDDSIEDGIFHMDPSDEEIERTICAADTQVRSYRNILDSGEGFDDENSQGVSTYDIMGYIEEWRELWHTMRVFRSHGIHATLGGG
jgi:hypothetical protein